MAGDLPFNGEVLETAMETKVRVKEHMSELSDEMGQADAQIDTERSNAIDKVMENDRLSPIEKVGWLHALGSRVGLSETETIAERAISKLTQVDSRLKEPDTPVYVTKGLFQSGNNIYKSSGQGLQVIEGESSHLYKVSLQLEQDPGDLGRDPEPMPRFNLPDLLNATTSPDELKGFTDSPAELFGNGKKSLFIGEDTVSKVAELLFELQNPKEPGARSHDYDEYVDRICFIMWTSAKRNGLDADGINPKMTSRIEAMRRESLETSASSLIVERVKRYKEHLGEEPIRDMHPRDISMDWQAKKLGVTQEAVLNRAAALNGDLHKLLARDIESAFHILEIESRHRGVK